MKRTFTSSAVVAVFVSVLFVGCKKDTSVIYPDNNAPYYDGIPKVKVQNYINRIFIDLIGREPLDAEMIAEENTLRAADFSFESREALIKKLQTNTDFIVGDSSYKHAYYNRFYELCKARVLEAASDADMYYYAGLAQYAVTTDSLAGDTVSMMLSRMNKQRNIDVVRCQVQYRNAQIEIKDIFARMLYNSAYDVINMNTFNFVNSSFDNLFLRLPTSNEFTSGYNMVEYGTPQIFLGRSGQNRGDYLNIMVNSDEFYEGIIRWLYGYLLQREPTTVEVNTHMQTFFNDHDVQKLQISIMKTDEYANF